MNAFRKKWKGEMQELKKGRLLQVQTWRVETADRRQTGFVARSTSHWYSLNFKTSTKQKKLLTHSPPFIHSKRWREVTQGTVTHKVSHVGFTCFESQVKARILPSVGLNYSQVEMSESQRQGIGQGS
eukprot:TRINITY_DN5859_c0_g2_i1.p1 TRINITY_DN5859_c0_g2~~TRINITY_DN5859_c0_g2_i1.p1  ORF type:complete len:127 (-),score=22.36 TRINITY_DN5859_c0_g2_i1:846-1226(-)